MNTPEGFFYGYNMQIHDTADDLDADNNALFSKGRYLGQFLRSTARLMIGIPDYENYCEHFRKTHPDLAVPSYESFFKERQLARYAGGGKRGCPC